MTEALAVMADVARARRVSLAFIVAVVVVVVVEVVLIRVWNDVLLPLIAMSEEQLFCTLRTVDMSDFTKQLHQRSPFRRPKLLPNHTGRQLCDGRPRILLYTLLASTFHRHSAVVLPWSPLCQSRSHLAIPTKGARGRSWSPVNHRVEGWSCPCL